MRKSPLAMAPTTGERILIADDDLRVASVVGDALELEGYAVDYVLDGVRAVERALSGDYVLVVLDWMLPLSSGLDACRSIRAESPIPILMLTARAEEADVIRAIEVGADDYVTKPFSVPEVVVRCRALLRRRELDRAAREAAAPEVLRVDGLELDRARHQASLDGRVLELTKTEFDLLTLFARRPGEVLTRLEIMRQLWQTDSVGDTRSCDFHVRNLRAKLEADPEAPRLLVTVRGKGYRLVV